MPITSKIILGEPLKDVRKYLQGKNNVVIITDANVHQLYEKDFPTRNVISIGAGEGFKTLHTVSNIYEKLLALGVDRSSFILAIGGGIVCDVAGFVASTFLRGIDFGFVPTTLLAQVDASIGGKNGVNFNGYKNIVGLFRQPEFIFYDFEVLKTLNIKELCCGLSEVIKHALIADEKLLNFLENNHADILNFKEAALKRIVTDSIRIKSHIVDLDEFESGERRKLNFGHTLGHALEKISDTTHGEAVATGMMFSARFSNKFGFISDSDVKRVEHILGLYNLPTEVDIKKVKKFFIMDAVKKDKKKDAQDVYFVFLKSLGEAKVDKIPMDKLEETIRDLC